MLYSVTIRIIFTIFAMIILNISSGIEIPYPACNQEIKIETPEAMCDDANLSSKLPIQEKSTTKMATIFEQKSFLEKLRKHVLLSVAINNKYTKTMGRCFRFKHSNKMLTKYYLNNNCQSHVSSITEQIEERYPESRLALALEKPQVLRGHLSDEMYDIYKITRPIKHPYTRTKLEPLTPIEVEVAVELFDQSIDILVDTFKTNVPTGKKIKEQAIKKIKQILAADFLSENDKLKKITSLKQKIRKKYAKTKWNYVSKEFCRRRPSEKKFYQELYQENLAALPIIGYLKSAVPDEKEIGDAFRELEKNSSKLIKKINDIAGLPYFDFEEHINLMNYDNIVNAVLLEWPEYCNAASRLHKRLKGIHRRERSVDFLVAMGAIPICYFSKGLVCLGSSVAGNAWIFGREFMRTNSMVRDSLIGAPNKKLYSSLDKLNQQLLNEEISLLFLPMGVVGSGGIKVGKAIGKKTIKAIPHIKTYFKKGFETKGLSLFAKESPKKTTALIWNGFIKTPAKQYTRTEFKLYSKAFSRLLARILGKKGHELTPIRGLGKTIEKTLFPKGKTFHGPIKFAGSWGTTMAIWTGAYRALGYADTWKINKKSRQIIENDYRFKAIAKKLNSKFETTKIDIDDAKKELSEIANQYNTYHRLIRSISDSSGLSYKNTEITKFLLADEEIREQISPLFNDIWQYLNPSFFNRDDFIFKNKKSVDQEMLHELMVINHERLFLYAQISGPEFDPGVIKEFKEDKSVPQHKTFNDFFKSKWAKQVIKLHRNNQIKNKDVIYWLANAAKWYSLKKEWEVIKATPLDIELNDTSRKILTDEKIMDEIFNDICQVPSDIKQ